MKKKIKFEAMYFERASLILTDILTNSDDIVTNAFVENGYWDLVLQKDGFYAACDGSYIVTPRLRYKDIHYNELLPCDLKGNLLSQETIDKITTEQSYEYQMGKTLTESFNNYKQCMLLGTTENQEYLSGKIEKRLKYHDNYKSAF